jgi:predicted ATPase
MIPGMKSFDRDPFIVAVGLNPEGVPGKGYPFDLPAVKALKRLEIHPKVTFFVGDNGSGKSTILEAIAVAMGFNAEGGSKNFRFETKATHSVLHEHLKVDKGRNIRKPKDGYFFRAESFYNLATEVQDLGVTGYGERELHEQSHGESFFAFFNNRLWANGIYLLDEPEAALSPKRQMSLISIIHRLVSEGSQLIIATHSPILLAYPEARIYLFSERGIEGVKYEETEHYQVTKGFLDRHEMMVRMLTKD